MKLKKGEISTSIFFYIFMAIVFVGILFFGVSKFFEVRNTISDLELADYKNTLQEAFNKCREPLSAGSTQQIRFVSKDFNTVCVLGENQLDSSSKYGSIIDFTNIYEGGDNVVLLRSVYEKSGSNYILRDYEVAGSFKIDFDMPITFCYADDENWVSWKDIEVGCEWHWDEVHDSNNNHSVQKYYLDTGSHILSFTYGLDQSRLDKLLITNDLDYIPNEIGPRTEVIITLSHEIPVMNQDIQFDGSKSLSTEGSVTGYSWDFGDGHKTRGAMVKHRYKNSGNFPVKLIVTDDAGLTGRMTKNISVYKNEPVARFNYTPERAKSNEEITFDASGSIDPVNEIIQYEWDFDDGSSANGKIVKHSFMSSGEYSVKVKVTNQNGITDSTKRLVTIISGKPKSVIFETDMCLDVDDVGALAVLHALANNDEAELLAVCYNEVHPHGPSTIDAINTWYGRGDIPVGVYKDTLSEPDYSPYLEAVSNFPHDLDSTNALNALDVYQNVLSEQPDSSVTIISVGFLNNLNDLLNANPELIAKKVKELVIMGGGE
jgi:PKD repeat protein